MAPQTLDGYLRGAMPSGDRLFALADVLKVNPRWLVTGAGPMDEAVPEADPDIVTLPRFDIFAFDEHGKPEPSSYVTMRMDWLLRSARTVAGLWIADMPSDSLPEVAKEGDGLICQDVDQLVDGRTYIFLLDGRPIVRKLQIRPEGLVLKAGGGSDPIIISGERTEHLIPIGRVVAAIALNTV